MCGGSGVALYNRPRMATESRTLVLFSLVAEPGMLSMPEVRCVGGSFTSQLGPIDRIEGPILGPVPDSTRVLVEPDTAA